MFCSWGATASVVVSLVFGSLFTFSGLYVGLVSVFLHRGIQDSGEINHTTKPLPVMCYFALDNTWPDNGTLHPALNATLCNHLIFISSGVTNGRISPDSPDDELKYFSKIPLLKKINPGLKIMLCNGGGGHAEFGEILGSVENRTRYINSTVAYLRKFGFDGLDLDWEFPGWQPNPRSQRPNFTMLVQEARQIYDNEVIPPGKERLLLTAAVAAGRSVMVIYDVKKLAQSLDYINLMCYDYHGYAYGDFITGYNSPLYPKTWRKQIVLLKGNMAWSSYEWLKRGMPKEKILVGIPTYLHAWKLLEPKKYHGLDAPADGVGTCDECSYSYVCDFLSNGGVSVFDSNAAVPYAYHGDQWISYDNVKSVTIKAQWILDNNFGGIMIYSLNGDDYTGHCQEGVRFPLISAITDVIHNRTAPRLNR